MFCNCNAVGDGGRFFCDGGRFLAYSFLYRRRFINRFARNEQIVAIDRMIGRVSVFILNGTYSGNKCSSS